ncbi:hypothetical protein DV515_00001805 [Chloebia gouldiae]|uniref:Uncharacterized protein n=1 Tax=Chloebia gouldiae TaxID=44316 RepID=A0A3L8SXL1_CHLGU|nr:hypothetical protein DV515_00001805 [Chloebia gouldiae]
MGNGGAFPAGPWGGRQHLSLDRLQPGPNVWLKAGMRLRGENGIETWLPKSKGGCQQDSNTFNCCGTDAFEAQCLCCEQWQKSSK